MCVLRNGAMVRIKGISGFGFVREILYFQQSKTTILYVEVYLHGVFNRAPFIHVLPDDVEIYEPFTTRAKSVLNHPDDHELQVLRMQEG